MDEEKARLLIQARAFESQAEMLASSRQVDAAMEMYRRSASKYREAEKMSDVRRVQDAINRMRFQKLSPRERAALGMDDYNTKKEEEAARKLDI
jgi:hypothetical protein